MKFKKGECLYCGCDINSKEHKKLCLDWVKKLEEAQKTRKTVPIAEIFASIQAEGKYLGVPSVFVRFYGCNLRCQFRGKECDTPYAVNTEKDKSSLMTVEQIIKEIRKFKSKHIAFTGGEPMLYKEFIKKIVKPFHLTHSFEIETNATIESDDEFNEIISWFNLSVKLKSSNQTNKFYDERRINLKAISSYCDVNSCFKFVYCCKKDLKEILKLHKNFNTLEIYLMPEGVTRKDIIKHSPEVINICIKYGFIFSPREHIMIWDSKRGV
jgi:7-carboxy-7-deazaguanine synthase